MGIFGKKKEEKPEARTTDRTPEVVVNYRDTTINWCKDRIEELKKITPYSWVFGTVRENEHIQKNLGHAIRYLENGQDLGLMHLRLVLPPLDNIVFQNVLKLARDGKADWVSFYDLPTWLQAERQRKIEEQREIELEKKFKAREEAAKLEADRIRKEQLDTASKLGISADTLAKLQQGKL